MASGSTVCSSRTGSKAMWSMPPRSRSTGAIAGPRATSSTARPCCARSWLGHAASDVSARWCGPRARRRKTAAAAPSDTRARYAAQGANPADQPDPRAAVRPRHHRRRSAWPGLSAPARGAQDGGRPPATGAAQGGDPARARADGTGLSAARRGWAGTRCADRTGSSGHDAQNGCRRARAAQRDRPRTRPAALARGAVPWLRQSTADRVPCGTGAKSLAERRDRPGEQGICKSGNRRAACAMP
jgi:hypothetical protein